MEHRSANRGRRAGLSAFFCLLMVAPLLGFPVPAGATPILWSPNDGGNGNFYEFIASGGIDWDSARADAQSMDMLGVSGHLATITSAEENAFFIANVLAPGHVRQEVWLGGRQLANPSLGPDEGWEWTTGEPWFFTNWNQGEPNDDKGRNVEESLAVWLGDTIDLPGGSNRRGTWNDDRSDSGLIVGYVVEFPTAIPEPSSVLVLALGVGLTGALRRKTSKHF